MWCWGIWNRLPEKLISVPGPMQVSIWCHLCVRQYCFRNFNWKHRQCRHFCHLSVSYINSKNILLVTNKFKNYNYIIPTVQYQLWLQFNIHYHEYCSSQWTFFGINYGDVCQANFNLLYMHVQTVSNPFHSKNYSKVRKCILFIVEGLHMMRTFI